MPSLYKSPFRAALLGAVLSLSSVAILALPLATVAEAKNGGNGGGNGGGKGGGNGGGNGGGGGNKDHGGGNGSGKGGGKSGGASHATADKKSHVKDLGDDEEGDDPLDGISANQLGKLNGFFHASSQALHNASPNSAHGRISQTFRDLLNDYADQQATEVDPNAPVDPNAEPAVSLDDLAAALASATNKPMQPEIVDAILDRLEDEFDDDYSDVTDPEVDPDEPVDPDAEPEPSFAEELSDKVNEIKGYDTDDEEEDAEPEVVVDAS